ncbi:DUF5666 domain-containing protein [Kaarinaea lacus]
MMKKHYGKYLPLVVLLPAVSFVGCSSSGSDGATGGSKTVGAITNVTPSSVDVAGITYSTGGASVSGDVTSSSPGHLEEGMIVSVDGTVDSSGKSGTAHHIEYDAEVEGKVISNDCTGTLPCSMDVMGQTIQINDMTHFRSNMPGVDSVHMIMAGAYVEVSGYSDDNGNIVATYVKVKDDHMESHYGMEVEGKITNLTDSTFEIGGQLIHYDPSTINLTLQEGMCVEVYLRDDGMGNMHVIDVEPEDDYGDDSKEGDKVEIEGMITSDGVAADGTFDINGQTVKLSDNVKYEGGLTQADIVKDAIIEVEGYRDENGMLIITEVGSEDDGDSADDGSSDDSSNDSSNDPTPTPL